MIKLVRGLVSKIPDSLLPESLVKMKTVSVVTKAIGVQAAQAGAETAATKAAAASSAVPAAVETGARGKADDAERIRTAIKEAMKDRLFWGKREEHITLEVEGETLARATRKADEDAAGRAFSPVPVY